MPGCSPGIQDKWRQAYPVHGLVLLCPEAAAQGHHDHDSHAYLKLILYQDCV